MAVLMPRSMGALNEEHKPVYPLFQRALKSHPPPPVEEPTASLIALSDDPDIKDAPRRTSGKGSKKSRRSVMVEKAGKEGKSNHAVNVSNINVAELLDVDPNNSRKKRRKSTPPDAQPNWGDENQQDPAHETHPHQLERRGRPSDPLLFPPQEDTSSRGVAQEQEKPICVLDESIQTNALLELADSKAQDEVMKSHDDPPNVTVQLPVSPDRLVEFKGTCISSGELQTTLPEAVQTKPKKTLRLNPKTGTFGSPPSKTSISQVTESAAKIRSSSRVPKLATRIVTISYGGNQTSSKEFGEKIEAILNGTRTVVSYMARLIEPPKPPKSMKILGSGPSAVPHPFFKPKAASKLASSQEVAESLQGVIGGPISKEPSTLGRARASPKVGMSSHPEPRSFTTAFAGSGSSSGILRFPGAIEPAWPSKGMVHIRGADEEINTATRPSELQLKSKKSKYQSTEVLAKEDILGILAGELCIPQVTKRIADINPDEYPLLPACLRVPTKHFEAGPSVQKRVRKELQTRIPVATVEPHDSSEDEIQDGTTNRLRIHPALTKAFTSISTALSAFDKAQCETHAWTHKYSPTSAAEVLQTGREPFILKEWLQNLTVVAVESGASTPKPSASVKPGFGKRKRKSNKLDGFIVPSDEEESDVDEISEPEDGPVPGGSQGSLKKTVIRTSSAAKDSARLPNSIVISGPHGCGKSAAVYAVAKELGFEVFEINSSSRRSGKDILEKVGDMTRNHLVHHAQIQVPAEPVDEDAQRISDALDEDLKSGRQGTMNSFFKTTETNAKPKPKKSAPAPEKSDMSKQFTAVKGLPKKQKQSLILFEEVDVLYEEDKQFWATVISLIVQSKRPIIMTCTDESAVPFQSFQYHAVLRFNPPPVDLATDYILLLAACEGHVIRREAVKSLYESRHLDLRASLTEMNFWCQFWVGSVKGGLEWFYDRWPPLKDVDENAKTIRVISEGTYEPGMGWLSQDLLESHVNYLHIEEETLQQAWDGWQLDVGHWQENLDLSAWADASQAISTSKRNARAMLAMYDDFAESMSTADLCSSGAFSIGHQVLMDTCQPDMSSKVREDYTVIHELIDDSPVVNHRHLGKIISTWMKSRSRNYLQVAQHSKLDLEIPTELDRPSEERIITLIRKQSTSPEFSLTRGDFSLAFDPISTSEKGSLNSTGSLKASLFDRTISLIATDVAPYVRSIVSFDARLQEGRARLSGLLSEGGSRGKRMRMTKTAMSALEGGARSTTRKNRYFEPGLNPHDVLKTGKQTWLDAMDKEMVGITIGTATSSRRSSIGDGDVDKVEYRHDERDELGEE